MKRNKQIVVIGGGTGTYSVLTGIKRFDDIDIKAIVTVTDSGGSSGKLRDEYGILPVGDIRQCLVALAGSENGNNLLRKLFLYRFDKGDIAGHNFGNLFLTAMTEILGTEEKAIEYTSKVLNIRGEVIPVTNKDIDLVAEYEDGTVLVGEANIDEPSPKHNGKARIANLRIQPEARISTRARQALSNADLLVLGPGDLYTSLLSNFVVNGAKKAFSSTRGTFVYICNLMTKYGQTSGFTCTDHINEITHYTGRTPDIVLINTSGLSKEILKRYEAEQAFPVIDDCKKSSDLKVIRRNFVTHTPVQKVHGDPLRRSLIRHDSNKIGRVLHEILLG